MNTANLNISQKALKSAVVALLAAVFAVVAYYVYKLNFDPAFDNRWAVAEWLINYEDGGFKRRGLSGSISFLIQDLTGLSLSTVVFASQMLFFGLLLFYLGKLSISSRLNLLFLTLLFTPITLLTYAYNPVSYAGRKEMIVMFTFAYFVYHLQNASYGKRQEIIVKSLLVFGVLMHELTFFYIPYFLFAEYVSTGKASIRKAAGYLLPVLIPVGAITLMGGTVDQGSTREILANRGVLIGAGGSLQYVDTVKAGYYITGFWTAYRWYIPAVLIGFLSYPFLLWQSGQKHQIKQFSLFFMIALLFTAPMFILAIDWGRWIHIHFMMLMTLAFLFLPKVANGINPQTDHKHQSWFNLLGLLMMVSSLFWKMDHCGYGMASGGFFDRIATLAGVQ